MGGFSFQSGAGSVDLNVFAHAPGLEVGVFFNASEQQVGVFTGEYVGGLDTLTFPKIPSDPVDKHSEKTHSSDWCQTLHPLTIYLLQQDLVLGTLIQLRFNIHPLSSQIRLTNFSPSFHSEEREKKKRFVISLFGVSLILSPSQVRDYDVSKSV